MPQLNINVSGGRKEIHWGDDEFYYRPSLKEILEAAELVFPGVSPDRMEIAAHGYDAEVIVLRERS